jgi:hypothetical protein
MIGSARGSFATRACMEILSANKDIRLYSYAIYKKERVPLNFHTEKAKNTYTHKKSTA